MTVGLATGSIVATPGQAISLSSLFTVTPGAGNPQYLVVSGLDRNEYTASSTGSTGTLSGNGHSTGFSSIGGDGLGAGIVFTYNASTGQYLNSTYGNLSDVVMTASNDKNRNESMSLFATNSASSLTQYAKNPYALEQFTTYVGTVAVVTQPSFGATPAQATPGSIASAAMSFVGQTWNNDGCWVLCSNIAAEAGASVPLTSTSLGIRGVANGEWIVAYDGPAGDGGNWQSMVKAGEMISFETSSTSGHITTVVSGAGASAMLVDNITYVNGNGSIANSAHDGAANDIVIAAPHSASQEFAQAVAGSVVIYELDTPSITAATSSPASVASGASLALSGLFNTSDPANHAVTKYQIYDTDTADTFTVNGAAQSAHSAASALTVSAASLATASLSAAGAAGVDTLTIRAFNGAYWGDWKTLAVNVAAHVTTPPPAAPVVSAQTANQALHSRRAVDFTLAANTFTDPQGLGMTYSAYQIGGKAAPWLQFNAATETFTGTANTRGRISLAVVATDTAGLSAVETFNVTLAPTAARFAQAVSSLNSGHGAGAAPPPPPSVSTLHNLYAPVA